MKYICPYDIYYYSERYDKHVTVFKGYESDGASGAIDVWSHSWWVHDLLCERGTWNDGTPVTNWQASTVLSDILLAEGRCIRARYWWLFTWLFGCKKARKNGMFPWSEP